MKSFFNREPLSQNSGTLLPLGEIRPRGWLERQLRAQADGITGKLDEIWPDVGEDSAWLGGDGDGWERAPYYLDGLVALAYTLDDERLKRKAQRYIEWILASRRDDGWFGPEKNDDYWPLIICLKALYGYFTATVDKRVLELMDAFFKYEYRNLDKHTLNEWACARGGDNIYLVIKMYNITGQAYLLELCKKLKEQTLDWTTTFDVFPNMSPVSKSVPWEKMQAGLAAENETMNGTARPYYHTLYHKTHGVNVAMGLKTPGVISVFKPGFKDQTGFKNGWEKLMKYHGTANGIFTCDEHINGNSPSRGTETCAVVEAMYSVETLMDVGDFGTNLPDILEKLAYNALPAPFTQDMMGRQYLQQTNQICSAKGSHGWYNNSDEANMFGLTTNFGCCTANLHQGWPKFAASLWTATRDGGLSAVSYAPCSLEHVIDGVNVSMDVRGNYPFGEHIEIEINTRRAIEFPLYLRVPFWSENTMIQLPGGEIMSVRAGETACVRERWNGMGLIRITFSMKPRVTNWARQSSAVEVGPLLMAMPLSENMQRAGGPDESPDYTITTDDDWRRAIVADMPMNVEFSTCFEGYFKNGEPPVKVSANVCRASAWETDGLDAGQIPPQFNIARSETEAITMIPYGYTNLRISQFPTAETGEDLE